MKKNPVRIVVLQRGWVVIGRHSTQGSETIIENAAIIRRWGTTKGLGELATSGKLENTILDECPPIRVPTIAVVMAMDCNQKAWGSRA